MEIMTKAGLGRKKIVFNQKDQHVDVCSKLEHVYPRLKDCGGFCLFRAKVGGFNRSVSKIKTDWMDVRKIRKKDLSGSGMIYIRPLQVNFCLTEASDREVCKV